MGTSDCSDNSKASKNLTSTELESSAIKISATTREEATLATEGESTDKDRKSRQSASVYIKSCFIKQLRIGPR